jgi:RNA polymerase sigma factor for flagellar operon FliA
MSLARKRFRSAPHALDLGELESLARFGLVDAATRYSPYCEKHGYDPRANFFLVYAGRRIRGAIEDRLRSSDWATRSLREKSRKINAATAGTEERLTVLELSEATGLTEKEVRDTMLGMSRSPISLEVAMKGLETESDIQVGLQIPEDEDTESQASVNAMLSTFADAVRDLPIEERLIIALHYHQGLDLKKCAAAMGIADAQSSVLHTAAVLKLLEILQEAAA